MLVKRLLLLPLVLTAACKPPTPAERMESVLSWIGTAGMVGDAWLRHATPDTYSRQTLELSGETLSQISSDLLKSPPPAIDAVSLDAALARSRQQIARMSNLITAKDAPAFARELDSLRAGGRFLKQVSKAIESTQ